VHHAHEAKSEDSTGDVILKVIQDLVAELRRRRRLTRPVTMDSSLARDLGLDSLARVELVNRLERTFNITLPERVFADAETPRDLQRAVLSASPYQDIAKIPELKSPELDEVPSVPYAAHTLTDVLKWHVQAHPDRPHIRFYRDEGEGEIMTYRSLMNGASSIAAALQHSGLKPGGRVAIMLPTSDEYFYAFMGILLAGGVPVPIYPPARRSQIEDHLRRNSTILRNCGASIMIIIPEAKRFAQVLKTQVESLRSLLTVTELMAESLSYRETRIGSQDIAFLQYTSGSTGNPKGVILTHANLLANMRTMGDVAQIHAGDVMVSWLPLYHDMGLIGTWLNSLYFASVLVLMSPLSFLSRPERWLWAIHRHRGTLSAAPNFAFELCLKRVRDADIQGLDLSSWRVACNGAEPVSPETVDRFCRRFGAYGFRREAFIPVYGLAECSLCLTFPPLDRGPFIDRIQRDAFMLDGKAIPAGETDAKVLNFVACGRPVPGHEVRIVDPADIEVPERLEGRLQFRGPSTTSGYFRNPEDTKLLFHDNWLESGDMAYIAEGEVFITGRIKDIIICSGRNIYPQELEDAIGDMEGVRKGNVVVFGTADPATGTEQLVVLAETREEDPRKLDALRTEINALTMDLAGTSAYNVVLTPPGTILKTSSGKIRRAANCHLYESRQIGKKQMMAWWQIVRVVLSGVLPELRRLRHVASAGLYAAYCWMLLCVMAPLTWLYVVLAPRSSWRWKFMRRAARFLAWATFTPLIIHGKEHLPRGRPCIIVSNHASYIDSFFMVAAIPFEFSFVAKAELIKNILSRRYLNRIGTEYVERFDAQRGVKDAQRISSSARTGRSILFFAEGTFTRVPGLLPFHMGAFLAAAEADLPVVPVAIRGTRSILLNNTWFPRRGMITITIGKPIEPAEVIDGAKDTVWSTALKLRDAARKHILRHCGEPDLAEDKSPLL
jgi:acyl carrier protein